MPGKVNPVIPEAVAMAAAQVIGNDCAITVAGQAGNFQLNVMLPVIASNRIGLETAPEGVDVTFYGSSFITDHTGQLLAKASRDQSQVLTARFDLDAIAQLRRSWGLFRDRRVDLYQPINRLGLAAL